MELFLDTETTGLPPHTDPIKDSKNWPRIVQLSWIFDGKENDYIIHPMSDKIPEDSTAIHGISDDYAREVGKDINDVMHLFAEDIKKADKIVGHNIDFDISVIYAHVRQKMSLIFLNDNIKTYLKKIIRIDTMKTTTEFCNIPGYYGPKWPKLEELYAKLFPGESFPAHNSLEDVRATKRCYEELRDKHQFRW